jgi:hypothetical protein
MKINKWFFLFLIVLLIINSSTALYFLVIKKLNYKTTDTKVSGKMIVDSQPVFISDFTDADYGITPDGTFFVSTQILGNPEEVLLTVIESNSINTTNKEIEETFENREIIRMKKEGDYFLGKSNKKYLNPAFYFKVDSWKCYPNFQPERFKKEDLIENQCGGLLLNKTKIN